jgi:hypothetical protein
MTSGFAPEQITRLSGLAADAVAEVDLYLSSGRVVEAALRDNAYAIAVPTTQLPGKLVAYDGQRRPLGIEILPGPARPVPCPPVRPAGAAPARRYERLDLGSGTVNGQPILGRGVAQVEAALGRPDRVRTSSISNGHREPTLWYGGTRPTTAALLVRFGWRQHRLRAISLVWHGRGPDDARLGRLLSLQPEELQRRVAAAYGGYRVSVGYGTEPERGCSGSFTAAGGAVELAFGLDPRHPSRPFLSLRRGF